MAGSFDAPDNDRQRSERVSLRDIGKKLGLSHVAVSLALRDSPRISAKRKKEVRAMAEKLGYRPDPMLSALAAYRQGRRPVEIRSSLAWLNQWDEPDRLRDFKEFDAYWRGAKSAAEHLGYRLEEFRWPRGRSGGALERILLNRDVRGILLPPHRRGCDLPDFDWDRFSIVRFGSSVKHPAALCVTSDQSHCAALAIQKALELGYKRIGYVSSLQLERNTNGHFHAGFLGVQEGQVSARNRVKSLHLSGDAGTAPGELCDWMSREKPDAIITTEASLRGLLDTAGVCVPKDIGVAGISLLDGNFDAAADQNSFEIGRVAANALAGLILETSRGIPEYGRRILVEGRWVDGGSLPPRNAGRRRL